MFYRRPLCLAGGEDTQNTENVKPGQVKSSIILLKTNLCSCEVGLNKLKRSLA